MKRITCAVLLTLSVTSPTLAATIAVPKDAPSIQAAIDRAVAGDTIQIAAGTFRESIQIDDLSDVQFQGQGPGITILQPSGSSIFSLSSSDHLRFKGMTLESALAGFDFWDCHDLRLEQLEFNDITWAVNSSGESDEIYVGGSRFSGGEFGVHSLWDRLTSANATATFVVEDNEFEGAWTGIFLDSSGHAILRRNTFTDVQNISIALNNWGSHDVYENLIEGGPVGLFIAEYDDEFYPPDFSGTGQGNLSRVPEPQSLRAHGAGGSKGGNAGSATRTGSSQAVMDVLFYNNIVYRTTLRGVYGYLPPMNDSRVLVRNNIFYQNTGTAIFGDAGSDGTGQSWNDRMLVAYDTFYGNAQNFGGVVVSPGGRGSSHNINMDPKFTDAAGGDFTLKARSMSVDSGTLDINGDGAADLTTYQGRSRDRGIEER